MSGKARVPKYAREVPPPPKLAKGELVVIENLKISEVDGKYHPQYQFEGKIKDTDYPVKAWVRRFTTQVPTVKAKIVKLCMAIEDRCGQEFDNIGDAIKTLEGLGAIYFEVSKHAEVDGITYPRFWVHANKLPKNLKQKKIGESEAAKADKVREQILSQTDHTEAEIDDMIAVELENSGGFYGEHTAAIIVAKNLKVDLEKTGTKIA